MTDYTIASPNGGTWSIQSANTAKVGRYHDLALLMEGASGPGNVFQRGRAGFLPGPTAVSTTQSPGAATVTPTTGFGWQIQPFAAVVERGSASGPYTVVSTAVGTGSVATADPSQTRVDRLDLVVFDGLLGDNGGVSLSKIIVTQGTPGGTTPAAPTGSIPIGRWTIPGGASSLNSGMWGGARKAAGLRGCVRLMLEGDALADLGIMPGELRDTSLLGGFSIDRWNPIGGPGGIGAWLRIADLTGAAIQRWNSNATVTTTGTSLAVPSAWSSQGVIFLGPASGIVRLDYSSRMHNANSGGFALYAPTVRDGGVFGTGSVRLTAAIDNAAQGTSPVTDESENEWCEVNGLTPGATYNAQMAISASTAGGTASFTSNRLLVTPQPT